jgi:hypothetical protein
MYSYLQYESTDTRYSYCAHHIWFDEFSALCHGDAEKLFNLFSTFKTVKPKMYAIGFGGKAKTYEILV